MSANEKIEQTIQTPEGPITFKEQTLSDIKKISAILRELTPAELQQLGDDAKRGEAFVMRYAEKSQLTSHYLVKMDSAFAAWMKSDSATKDSRESVIRAVGAAYGFYCIKQLGMRWAWIKDEYGEDIALVADSPETRSFPFTSIRYRIEDKKSDFLYALYATLAHSMGKPQN